MNTLEQKAGSLLSGCKTFTLCTVTEEGYPRPCILSRLKSEGCGVVYASTGTSSAKTRHLKQNPHCGVCYTVGGDSVTLLGKTVEITDKAVKDSLWSGWMQEHFAGGKDDPEYCVLKFTAIEGTFWIGGVFETHRWEEGASV